MDGVIYFTATEKKGLITRPYRNIQVQAGSQFYGDQPGSGAKGSTWPSSA